jgi:hypothetical protein
LDSGEYAIVVLERFDHRVVAYTYYIYWSEKAWMVVDDVIVTYIYYRFMDYSARTESLRYMLFYTWGDAGYKENEFNGDV